MKSLIELFNNLCELYKELPELTKNLIYLLPILTLLWSSCVLWYDKLKHLVESYMNIFLISLVACLSLTLFSLCILIQYLLNSHKKFFGNILYSNNNFFCPACKKLLNSDYKKYPDSTIEKEVFFCHPCSKHYRAINPIDNTYFQNTLQARRLVRSLQQNNELKKYLTRLPFIS